MTAFALNVGMAVVLSLVLNALKVRNGTDRTEPSDYFAEAGDPRVDQDLAAHDRKDVRDEFPREII